MEQTINYKGYKIEIVQDSDPESPRQWDNPSHMYTWHRRYNIGDKHPHSSPKELLMSLAGVDEEQSIAELLKLIESRGTIIQPIYLYDHSGITISTSPFGDRWDSGQVGWIYMTKETMEKEGWTREQALKYMEGEVETYDQFLTGEVYGYNIEETGDSCYGYYGDPKESGCIDEAKSCIDWYIKAQTKKHLQQLKQWIKLGVNIMYRKPLSI